MAQLSHLLLFDPDPRGLDTLAYAFEKDGCPVTGTADPAKARDLAHTANLSLMLVALRDSEQVGFDLLRAITTNPRTRNLPCVAIGRDQQRRGALAAGAFVFLSMPLFVRDAIGVCRMVTAAAIPGSRPSPDAELSLNLPELGGIYFLVRALAVTGRSAVVEARRGQRRSELRFMDGTLTSAVAGAVQGIPALHQMLLWEDAALHFKFKNVVRRGTQLSMKTGQVLEECDRFLRDFAHEVKDLGVARTIYAAQLDRGQPPAALPSEVIPILKLFDGRRDLAQVLDESPFRIFDTLKIIHRFAADGNIHRKTPVPAARELPTSVAGPGALETWLERQPPVLGSELSSVTGNPRAAGPVTAPRPGDVGGGGATAAAAGQTTDASGDADGGKGDVGVASVTARTASPFVVLGGAGGNERDGSGAGDSLPSLRHRTPTKRNPPDPPAVLPEDMVTPPPVVRPAEVAAKPAPAVARGEIRVNRAPQRRSDAVPVERTQSVMVELGALPPSAAAGTITPPPVAPLPAPVPSVIIAPMTPAVHPGARPVAPPVASVIVASTPRPQPSLPVDPHAPSVIVAHMTPPPVTIAPPAAPVSAAGGENEPPSRSGRHSDSFNAVEADFFDREADLYKRDSVESFDDLDQHHNGVPKRSRR